MNDLTPFEQEIRQTYRLPTADPAFFDNLEAKLQAYLPHPEAKARPTFHFARGGAFAIATFLLLVVIVFAIGPSKVLAQIRAVFGFVPNVGLVDTSSPFRQLAAPVSDTRDGITLAIQSAFLSADQTTITYAISALPAEMASSGFGSPGCTSSAYLVLPDGGRVAATGTSGRLAPDGSFVYTARFNGLFPANFNQASLVFPCLTGTAQGKGPQDWQIALAFKPAPEDLVVYPATLMPPLAGIEDPVPATMEPAVQSDVETGTPSMPAMIVDGDREEAMVLLGVVEKPDAYWVTWAYPNQFDYDIQSNGQLTVAPFNPVLYDANGASLPEPDRETQLELWDYTDTLRNQLSGEDQLKYLGTMHTFVVPKSGVAFPVYVKQNVYERSFPEKEAFAEVEFDGAQVQTSDGPVEINQEIQLGSVQFTLEAIEKSQFGGYSFLFDGADGRVVQCVVEVVDHPTDMSGSGGFNLDDPFHFSEAVMYREIPTGKLTVRISQPAVLGDLISFVGSWSPEN